jgi:hypothetical protein
MAVQGIGHTGGAISSSPAVVASGSHGSVKYTAYVTSGDGNL